MDTATAAARVPASIAANSASLARPTVSQVARNPAQKASPAPVVSLTTAGYAGKSAGPDPAAAMSAPSGPSFTTATP